MQVQGKLTDTNIDLATKKLKLTFLINNNITSLEEIEKADLLDIEIKKHRKRRSKNANAYCWKLMGELAERLGTTSDEIYEIMLQRYGSNLKDEDDNIVMISSRSELRSNKDLHIAFIGTGITSDKIFNHYRVVKGSSQYDTKEMSIFIDGVVQEAQEQGITTDTPEQIQKYKEMWK